MADTRTRIINLPEATTLDSSMNFVEDSADGSGTRRITYDTLKGAINQEGAANLAPAYSNAATYNVGDLCTYQGTLYSCVTQISTAEDWTAAHWTAVNVSSEISELKEDFTAIMTPSKNLLPDTSSELVVNNVTCRYSDGTMTVNGTANNDGGRLGKIITFSLPAGTYRAWGSASTNLMLHKVNGNVKLGGLNVSGFTFTLDELTDLFIGITTVKNATVDATFYIQIEEGTEKTDWEAPSHLQPNEVLAESIQTNLNTYIANRIIPQELENGKYVNYVNGNITNLDPCSVTPYIMVKPNAKFSVYNFTIQPSADARGLAFYDKNKKFVSGVQYPVLNVLTGVVPANAYYVRLTVTTAIADKAIMYCAFDNDALIESEYYNPSIAMFEKVGFCGDSYVQGQLYGASGVIGDRPNIAWGSVIGRLCGLESKIYASSGADTNTWQTRSGCLPAVLAEQTPCGLYIFCMGINDASYVTLGSIADITSHDSYEDYPNTFYGNYGKIIEQILAYSQSSKIILMTPFHPRYNARYVTPLTEISQHYGIAMINTQDSILCNSEFVSGLIGGHPTSVQHSQMANSIIDLVADCIKKYNSYFAEYHGIS